MFNKWRGCGLGEKQIKTSEEKNENVTQEMLLKKWNHSISFPETFNKLVLYIIFINSVFIQSQMMLGCDTRPV